jgi:hypothetical protein
MSLVSRLKVNSTKWLIGEHVPNQVIDQSAVTNKKLAKNRHNFVYVIKTTMHHISVRTSDIYMDWDRLT